MKSEFEKEAMVGTETADTHYGKAKEVLVVNEQFLQKAIIGSVAELSSIASLSDLTDMISEQTLDKIVCIKSFQNPVMDDNLEELFIKSEGSLGEYFMAAWDLEYYELSSNLRDLYGFASNVKPRTDYSANGHDFLFMVGKASGVSITGGAFLDFEGDFYPAIDQKYLTRIGVKLSPEDIKILEEDKKALDEIKKSETAIYEEMKISHKELMKAQRASIRKMFCARWFGVMFNVLISFLMLRLLTAYYSILRRKDMRKKTTH
ncbi:MAG: hypothetical protein PHY48_15890, partial [Candidatus Cloacimonetes bacterium]|nr:hypothetical protein [Candidatus Cloacimonadota bacterium]